MPTHLNWLPNFANIHYFFWGGGGGGGGGGGNVILGQNILKTLKTGLSVLRALEKTICSI